ncbi:MAG: hypothetical protein JST70_04770 [Bacteroidetes bacterium]|nr:hypothetical protein [Bacteroidota bacterium]
MDVYRVTFDNNRAVSATKTDVAKHGDIALYPNDMVNWYAVECESEQMAIIVAQSVVNEMWRQLHFNAPLPGGQS